MMNETPIPNREFHAVRLPFKVTGTSREARNEKVYAHLGGSDAVVRGLDSEQPESLRAWFEPENSSSRVAVESTTKDVNYIVFKVRREKNTGKIVSSEPLGNVKAAHEFHGPCDLVFNAPKRLEGKEYPKIREIPNILRFCDSMLNEDMFEKPDGTIPPADPAREASLFVPPPSFLPNKAMKYPFPDDVPEKHGDGDDDNTNASKLCSMSGEGFDLGVGLDQVPGFEDFEIHKDIEVLVPIIREMFDRRPAWSKDLILRGVSTALGRKLTVIDRRRIHTCMDYLSYRVKSGAFGTLWLRRGYDPRFEKDSARYQVLIFKLSKKAAAKFASLRHPKSKKGAIKFLNIDFSIHCRAQLVDICSSKIQEKLTNHNPSRTFTPENGWFEASQLVEFRDLLTRMADDFIDEWELKGDYDAIDDALRHGDSSPSYVNKVQEKSISRVQVEANASEQVQPFQILGDEDEDEIEDDDDDDDLL